MLRHKGVCLIVLPTYTTSTHPEFQRIWFNGFPKGDSFTKLIQQAFKQYNPLSIGKATHRDSGLAMGHGIVSFVDQESATRFIKSNPKPKIQGPPHNHKSYSQMTKGKKLPSWFQKSPGEQTRKQIHNQPPKIISRTMQTKITTTNSLLQTIYIHTNDLTLSVTTKLYTNKLHYKLPGSVTTNKAQKLKPLKWTKQSNRRVLLSNRKLTIEDIYYTTPKVPSRTTQRRIKPPNLNEQTKGKP